MNQPKVLIVGAGPTGLMMAIELARRGIIPRIIDKAPHPPTTSRALAIFARTLEIFDDAGLANEAIQRGLKVHGINLYAQGKRIVHVYTDELDSPFSFILSLPQSETERLLAQLAERLGVEIERPVTLIRLEPDADGVTAHLRHPDGRRETYRAAWVIGCDGVHSAVRREAGLEYEGVDLPDRFMFIDARAAWDLPADEGHAFLSDDGVLVAIPLPREGYWRIIVDLPPDTAPPEDPDLAFFERFVAERTHLPARLTDNLWISDFGIHQRMVDRYRAGPILLVGDAAHSHSPVGAQGMNTGLQDAYNLAWKLALVIQGVGRPELLDSYEAERKPIARSVLTGTEWATRVVTLRHPIPRHTRRRLAQLLMNLEVVQQRLVRTLSELVLDYRQSAIVQEDRASLLQTQFWPDSSAEKPDVWQWFDFGGGPRPGDRAPDASIQSDRTESGESHLFEVFRGTGHTLLLLSGAAATEPDYGKLCRLVQTVEGEVGNYIAAYVVTPGEQLPEALLCPEAALLDSRLESHHRYGAGTECLYLIRPDGYIGYRSQPADLEKLRAYLHRIFATGG